MGYKLSSRTFTSSVFALSARRGSFFFLFVTILLLVLTCLALILLWPSSAEQGKPAHPFSMKSADMSEEVIVELSEFKMTETRQNCTYHSCFEVYNCGYHDEANIRIYVYPYKQYIDSEGKALSQPITKEFEQILLTIARSRYYTSDPERACLFVPSTDLLNQEALAIAETGHLLASLPRWNHGTNHLLFNMLPGGPPDFRSTSLEVQTGNAVVAGGGFDYASYRHTFDVSIPVFSSLMANAQLESKLLSDTRRWLLISSQTWIHDDYRNDLKRVLQNYETFLLLNACQTDISSFNPYQRCSGDDTYNYPQVLQDSDFCLVLRGARLGHTELSDALMTGCIPVIVADGYVMPFSEVLDWKRAAVFVREDDLDTVMNVLVSYSHKHVLEMRQQGRFFWEEYFSSMKTITLTTLRIINDRVFPYASKSYESWNDPPSTKRIANPLFWPLVPPKSHGFTAVILTYDRIETLFTVIRQVAKAPSLAKVIVVWNNQNKMPPAESAFPKFDKPVKVIKTKKNRLSNRFYPYDEIETECILALDDDIIMLTADELEFGYQVWREFPDRLVGFPSRLHLWDNGTQRWKYESEWTNEISMVLTGAAFYHKYFSYLYTKAMPGNIKSWVDEHMNCEDIAMNFLISNITGKAPIKVTPRKKFKCPECANNEMLSADLTHMVERSECITRFASLYETMPLKTVEFRADPVLYKDNLPSVLTRYKDVGSL